MTTHWLDRPRNGLVLTFVIVAFGGAWRFNSDLSELNRDAVNKDRELNQMHAEISELRHSPHCRRPNE